MWVGRTEFLKDNRAAFEDFVEDYMRALRFVLDPKNHDVSLQAVVQFTKQSRESVDYAFTEGDYFRSPDMVPDVPGIQRGIDQAVEAGVLKEPLKDMDSYIDLHFIKEAKRRVDGEKKASR
jgi:ABC-type nitrate/sulfonate/bicarbonate transport system substrate-binding protein